MWKPIRKAINYLYDKYGDKPQPIKPHEIIIDKTELKHLAVRDKYNYIEHCDIEDYPYFKETIKDSLIDKLSECIPLTEFDDEYGNKIYRIDIWIKEN